MVLDYSKWDNLELSDDSDVEVHPNVDKKSFIRWRQRDIHEKRERNKFRAQQLEVNLEVNQDLLSRIDRLIAAADAGTDLIGQSDEKLIALATGDDKKDKPALATSPEQPKYSDMISSLLEQVREGAKTNQEFVDKVHEHRKMIVDAMADESKEMEQLKIERARHISSDDIHDGWNSTIVQHNEPQTQPSTGSTKKTEIEVLNPGAKAPQQQQQQQPITTPKVDKNGLEELLPDTLKFGEIKTGDLPAAMKFLESHPWIVRSGQKDMLLMKAYDEIFEGRKESARRIIYNSLLLQYSAMIDRSRAGMFFQRLMDTSDPKPRQVFEEEVASTLKHIESRCEILSKEQEESGEADGEGVEQIQLHAVDPGTQILIEIPPEDAEGYQTYLNFKPELKAAVQTQSLDEINKYLATLSVEEAEDVVHQLDSSGVLQIGDDIYDAADFEQKKAELAAEEAAQESTIDELD